MDMEHKNIQLLDLSDELLLNIFRHCSPGDLKAFSFTCERLGRLVLDRTLWQCVDARDQQTGRTRLKWYLMHALHNDTKELHMTGYAREAKECIGYFIRPKPSKGPGGAPCAMTRSEYVQMKMPDSIKSELGRNKWMLIWLENEIKKFDDVSAPVSSVQDSTCPGPHFTLSAALMVQLQIVCPALTSMSGAISQFPPTLRHLSLRGVRCYNMRRRFLNRISNYLPYLESLDGSECEFINCLDWPTLSELRNLRRLILQNCTNLNGTMYLGRNKINFGKLEVLDLRESQVSIAEVRELGLMPKLQKLYTSSPPVPLQICTHGHFKDDTLPSFQELDGWELEEPEYLKKYSISINLDDIERNPWIPSPYLTEDQYYEAFDNYWRTIQALCFKQNKINNDDGEDRNNVNENIINNNDNRIDQNENEIVRND